MSLKPGTRLGPYEVAAKVGQGGMGEVYKATDTRLHRTVAIKVLSHDVASDLGLKQRFEREARTVAALNHPHICTLHDIGSQGGVDFLVMEYLDGKTLTQRLARGALPLDQALQIAIEVADALDAAHQRGVVHRDMKPGNIMLDRSRAKLLDFGLAKLRDPGIEATRFLDDRVAELDHRSSGATPEHRAEQPTLDLPLTAGGAILGTFQYMAPEQVEGRNIDARTVYSPGVRPATCTDPKRPTTESSTSHGQESADTSCPSAVATSTSAVQIGDPPSSPVAHDTTAVPSPAAVSTSVTVGVSGTVTGPTGPTVAGSP